MGPLEFTPALRLTERGALPTSIGASHVEASASHVEASASHVDDDDHDDDEEGGVAVEAARPKLKQPPKYAVVLHNDDYTTMEFVIEVLERFFKKTREEALEITLRVHNQGRGVAGIYGRDIAETKAEQVNETARARGFPLKSTVEPT